MARRQSFAKIEEALRAHALAYPETTEEFPWGHRAIKVRGKSFVFLVLDDEGLSLSVKLPQSRDLAVDLPFAEPTGYGMGKSGWVTARFAPGADVPVDLLKGWLDESFRAIAPKKLVKQVTAAR